MKTLQTKTTKELLKRDIGKKYVLEGMTDNRKRIIYVNIEHVWDTAKNINEFIYRFTTVLAHEHLHLLINDECYNSWLKHSEIGDELVIRKITGEPTEEIKAY